MTGYTTYAAPLGSISIITWDMGLENKFFLWPEIPIASSKASKRCCEKKPVHLWAPWRNLREPQENSRELWAPGLY